MSAYGTQLPPLSTVIVSRINRSILKNYALLRGAFHNLISNIVSHISKVLH